MKYRLKQSNTGASPLEVTAVAVKNNTSTAVSTDWLVKTPTGRVFRMTEQQFKRDYEVVK